MRGTHIASSASRLTIQAIALWTFLARKIRNCLLKIVTIACINGGICPQNGFLGLKINEVVAGADGRELTVAGGAFIDAVHAVRAAGTDFIHLAY